MKPAENGYSVILNEPLHNFRLVKYDPLTNALLSGAEFTLKGTSDYGTPVDKTETSGASGSEEGIVFFKGLEPGHYTLQETKAPERYQLDPTVRTVTVSSAGEITVSGLTKRPSDWHSGFYTDWQPHYRFVGSAYPGRPCRYLGAQDRSPAAGRLS